MVSLIPASFDDAPQAKPIYLSQIEIEHHLHTSDFIYLVPNGTLINNGNLRRFLFCVLLIAQNDYSCVDILYKSIVQVILNSRLL